MNLVTHAFRHRVSHDTLVWTDDPTRVDSADHPAWAVWESACGDYRVVFDGASDTFSPQSRTLGTYGHVEWTTLAPSTPSLEQAQQVAGEVHRA